MQFRRSLCATLFPAMFLLAQVSHASVDGYGLGSGRDGLLAGSFGGPVNAYAAIVAAAGAGAVSVTVGDAWAFSAGDLALIIQTTGIASIPAPGGAGPIDLAQEKLGRYELARIADVIGNSIEFTDPLINAYASAGAQVVRVPEFTDVTLDKFSRIYPPPFDGTTGGIVAFLATGTITLPTGASIDASVTGFRGGQPSGGGDDSLGCTALQLDVPTAGARRGAQAGRVRGWWLRRNRKRRRRR